MERDNLYFYVDSAGFSYDEENMKFKLTRVFTIETFFKLNYPTSTSYSMTLMRVLTVYLFTDRVSNVLLE